MRETPIIPLALPVRRLFAGAVLVLLALWMATAATAQEFPKLTGRVTDAARIIPDDIEARLTQKLQALEEQSQRQLVVATIPDLQGYDIADYGYRLGREWGIGGKERNDGAMLIVAPNERKVRVEVGYGLEPVLTDGLSFLIIDQRIIPRFRNGDMPGGIEAGVDAIIEQLTLPPEEAQRIAAQAAGARAESRDGSIVPMIVFGAFALMFFVLPVIGSMMGGGRRRYRRGRHSPIVWMPGGFAGGSSGGSFGGSFGGFSGGGGSFGGGGSSGSW